MDRKYGIIELLTKVGEEHIKLQNLIDSMEGITIDKRGDSRITFLTNQITPTEIAHGACQNMGLVVWLPTALVTKAKAEIQASGD